MSILIKGMEMPKGCGKCKLFDASHTISLVAPLGLCRVNGKEIFRVSEKADFCPLFHVPPHGRLIDADTLAVHKFVGDENDISISDGGACYRKGWNDAIEAIMENAETIIGGE